MFGDMLDGKLDMAFPLHLLPSSFQRVQTSISLDQADAFLNWLVPPPDQKLPFTLATIPFTLSPLVLVFFMAYLARRPNTWHLRLALAPLALIVSIRVGYAYECKDPIYGPYNFGIGLAGVAAVAKILDWASAPKGILKMGELEPGRIATPAVQIEHALQEAEDKDIDNVPSQSHSTKPIKVDADSNQRPAAPSFNSTVRKGLDPTSVAVAASIVQNPPSNQNAFLRGFLDAAELVCSMRGIGWAFGTGTRVYVVHDWRNTEDRAIFLRQSFKMFLTYFVIVDIGESILKMVPGVGSPQGGSIFAFGDNALEKYTISTLLNMVTGFCILTGFTMVYTLLTLVGVGLLQHDPTSWPPIFDRPWAAESLHAFWSSKWHQLLRHTFLTLGGYPLQALGLGLPGLVFGTFLASGLYHHWALHAMGRGTDRIAVWFFVFQAFGVMFERAWYKGTGRKISGWPGTAWVWLWIVGGGQLCINVWQERGFAGGFIIPPILSPARQITIPLIKRIIEAIQS